MGNSVPLTTRAEVRNGVAWVALGGELDLATAPVFKKHLTHVEQDGVSAILLDLRDLTFIDSTGLHALLQAKGRAQVNQHRLILVGASEAAQRVFELTGTQYLLNEEEAASTLDRFTGSTSHLANQNGQTSDDARA